MFRKLLTGPTYESVEQQRKARLLHTVTLMGIIIATLVAVSGRLFAGYTEFNLPLLGALALPIVVQIFIWRGQVLFGSWLFVSSSWLIIAWTVITIAGIEGRYFSSFTLIIFLAFGLLPKRNYLIFVALSCFVGVGAAYFAYSGLIVPNKTTADHILVILFTQMGQLLVAVVLFASTYSYTNRLLRQSEQSNTELAQTNRALKSSETRYRALMQNASEAILLIDIDENRIIEVNEQAVTLFGYSHHELVKMSLLALSAPTQPDGSDHELFDQFVSQVFHSDTVLFEWQQRHASGREFVADVRLTRAASDSKRIVRASIVDITERKAVAYAVQQSLADLQSLHQITANAEIDAQEKIKQLLAMGCERFGYSMAALTELDGQTCRPKFSFGIPEEHVVERPEAYTFHRYLINSSEPLCISDFSHSAEHRNHPMHIEMGHQSLFAAAIHRADVYYGTLMFLSSEPRQAQFRPMDIELIKLMAQWIGSMISRQKAEDERAESVQMLELIIDNIPGRIGYADSDERVIFINNRLGSKIVEADTMIGRTLAEVYGDETYAKLAPYVKRVLQGERVSFEQTHAQEDGSNIYSSVIYVPHFENERQIGFFAMAIDVTQLRKTELALSEAQKMESLGVLAGGIAHDFNNLLVAMLGQNSLAQAKLPAEHPAYRHVNKAISASRRAAALTQQMLAYSGRGQFEIRRIDINQLLRENLDLFKTSIATGIHLKTEFHAQIPTIEADAAQMQQVVMNLILNAAQAIGDKGGTITICTGERLIAEQDSRFWQYTGEELEPGNYVMLEVQDDGVGMDDETRQRIFDPFFTTKPTGSGLGLAAVVGIMRGHGGGIHISSELGKGTTFRLLFRAAAAAERTENNHKKLISAESHTSSPYQEETFTQSVLVIDDEPLVLELVSDILETKGIPIIIAASGEEGLKIYETQRQDISLVLLDLSMPGLTGGETYQALRHIDPEVRVILSSGYNESEATRDFIGQGLVGFIQKPYDLATLAAKLKDHLNPAAV